MTMVRNFKVVSEKFSYKNLYLINKLFQKNEIKWQ
jgi:hypothetical protein